jgi:MFS family permease
MLSRVEGARKRAGESLAAFRDVLRNPNLRNLELAWTASIIGTWAYLVAVSVYAFDVGGATAVGLLYLLRLVPAALITPFAGLLADRYRRDLVLLGSLLARGVLIGAAAACVFLDVSAAVVYALAVAASLATTPFRPAQAAMMPGLAQSPSELTAANAVASTMESLASFVGPAIAGLLLGFTSIGTVFLVNVGLVVVAAAFVLPIRVPRKAPEHEIEASTIASELFTGFRTVGREPSLRVLIGLFTAQTLVAGALAVYTVGLAIDVLGLGDGGVGYLNSALGVGALVGGVFALGLTGARRLGPPFVLGVLLWGVPLILIGIWPNTLSTLLLLGAVGFGNSFVDVAAFTLVQRAVPDEILARVFGVIQMLWFAAVGIGAILAPALSGWLGIEDALIVTGAFLPVLVVLLGRQLSRIDAAAHAPDAGELRVLASVPIFAPLPGTSLEHLAGRLLPLRIETGTVVVREGDTGDRFYIVAEGEVEVSEDGRHLAELGPGQYFGEIALLRDLPRTATVTARTPVVLYALDREDFLAAVTGHAPSAQAAEEIVSARLTGLPAAGTPLSSA